MKKTGKYSHTIALVLALAAIFAQRRGLLGDGEQRFNALSDLLLHGQVSAGKYSLVGPLFATPLFYLGKAIHNPAWGCISYNFVLFCLGLWALRRALRAWLTDDEWFAFALVLTMGSMFPSHLQGFYGEVFTALLVAAGLAWGGRGWGLAVVGAINTPATVPALALSVMERRRWRWLAVPALAAAGILLENFLRRGSFFASGYGVDQGDATAMPFSGRPGFSYPFLAGVLSILFSFGKGLVFYCPGFFAPRTIDAKKEPRLHALERSWWLFTLGLILVYAKWWAWYGGWFWGPRFFLFASLPASLRLALAYRRARAPRALLLCLLLLAWSFWVGVNGIVFGTGDLDLCIENHNALEAFCWYTPEFSPLFRPFLIGRALHADRYLTLALFGLGYLYLTFDGWRRLYLSFIERSR